MYLITRAQPRSKLFPYTTLFRSCVMSEAEFRRAFRFVLRELAKIIVEPVHRTAVEPSPERSSVNGFYDYFRSEEHTSELQSQSNLVCRLLLEKKNLLWGDTLPD